MFVDFKMIVRLTGGKIVRLTGGQFLYLLRYSVAVDNFCIFFTGEYSFDD